MCLALQKKKKLTLRLPKSDFGSLICNQNNFNCLDGCKSRWWIQNRAWIPLIAFLWEEWSVICKCWHYWKPDDMKNYNVYVSCMNLQRHVQLQMDMQSVCLCWHLYELFFPPLICTQKPAYTCLNHSHKMHAQ